MSLKKKTELAKELVLSVGSLFGILKEKESTLGASIEAIRQSVYTLSKANIDG